MNTFTLKTLSLNNFATFQNEKILFNNQFNAIIGETGSGKSIILDAIQLIFGQRADKKLIRKDSDFCTIEASFTTNGIKNKTYFDNLGYPFNDDEIIVKRIIYKSGKSKSFLNHQSCPLSSLIGFSKKFIDLVGQFENQKLLSRDYQIQLLDSYGPIKPVLTKYTKKFFEYNKKLNTLEKLKLFIKNEEQKIDFIHFQINEINNLNPTLKDENLLISTKENLLNDENKKCALNDALNILSDKDDYNILKELKLCIKNLNSLKETPPLVNQLNDCYQSLEDVSFQISSEISSSNSDFEIDPILDRLDQYQKLKRKFGTDTQGLIQKKSGFENELQKIDLVKDEVRILEKDIQEIFKHLMALAKNIHLKRIQYSIQLSKELTSELNNLKMEGATVKIDITENDKLNEYGISQIAFNAETNPGEGFYEIKKVASGGELSRILLSLRKILSSSDSISIFLFDEIDAGIGGETALCIGQSLKNVSRNSQVIAITHLPQIAKFADKLIQVSKLSEKNQSREIRTISHIKEITGKYKLKHIQAMTPLN
jgi:DNA repair protein RecN (Recombination protein N)